MDVGQGQGVARWAPLEALMPGPPAFAIAAIAHQDYTGPVCPTHPWAKGYCHPAIATFARLGMKVRSVHSSSDIYGDSPFGNPISPRHRFCILLPRRNTFELPLPGEGGGDQDNDGAKARPSPGRE